MPPSDNATALEKVVGTAERVLTGRKMFTDMWVKARRGAAGAEGNKERPATNPFLSASNAADTERRDQ